MLGQPRQALRVPHSALSPTAFARERVLKPWATVTGSQKAVMTQKCGKGPVSRRLFLLGHGLCKQQRGLYQAWTERSTS